MRAMRMHLDETIWISISLEDSSMVTINYNSLILLLPCVKVATPCADHADLNSWLYRASGLRLHTRGLSFPCSRKPP